MRPLRPAALLFLAVASLALAQSSPAQKKAVSANAATTGAAPAGQTSAAPIVITGADIRPALSLDGDWHAIVDPYFSGLWSFHHEERKDGYFLNRKADPADTFPTEYDFAKAPTLKVPADWNTQRAELFFYEGPVWYERDFSYSPKAHRRIFLHVGAANYKSWFWVNGQKACEHEGGFTTFDCEVTALVKDGSNFIVAAVDNTRHEDQVPTLETDWWNYGGLHRSVSLIEVPEAFIGQYDVHLDRYSGSYFVRGAIYINRPSTVDISKIDPSLQPSIIEIPELHIKAIANHCANANDCGFRIQVNNLELWSPENPKLYDVVLTAGEDRVEEKIGFRTIQTRGTQILLNDKPVFLRGVSIHAEAPYRTGRANTAKDAETLLGWAKELGCNYVRLAHYPHDESMLRAADRMGLMVWSENPVYWALEFDNPKVLEKAQQQLTEEIQTGRNHASIILWSMANETPDTEARTRFIETLAQRARGLDPTRLITAALLVRSQGTTKIVDDKLGQALDVIGVNEYIGWYEQRPETADITTWKVAFQKPLIVSEFGGGARAGLHGAETDRWTEEYQASIYKHQLPMLNRIPQLRGMSPWVLMDFRSPNRPLTGVQDEFNRKGLISDQGEKKAAFFVLQKAYKDGTVGKAE